MRIQSILILSCVIASLAIANESNDTAISVQTIKSRPTTPVHAIAPFDPLQVHLQRVGKIIIQFWENVCQFIWGKPSKFASFDVTTSSSSDAVSSISTEIDDLCSEISETISEKTESSDKEDSWEHIRDPAVRERSRRAYYAHLERMEKAKRQELERKVIDTWTAQTRTKSNTKKDSAVRELSDRAYQVHLERMNKAKVEKKVIDTLSAQGNDKADSAVRERSDRAYQVHLERMNKAKVEKKVIDTLPAQGNDKAVRERSDRAYRVHLERMNKAKVEKKVIDTLPAQTKMRQTEPKQTYRMKQAIEKHYANLKRSRRSP